MTTDTARGDIYSRITDRIIAAIETGAGDWRMPWHTDGSAQARPVNVASGKAYRGINTLALWVAGQAMAYRSATWGTYKQWQELGAQVKRGEKAAPVVFWKVNDSDTDDAQEDGEGNARRRIVARGYCVFNADQVEGWTPPAEVPAPSGLDDGQRIAQVEAFFRNLGATITEDGSRAFYRPATDSIHMPPFAAFTDPVSFYATLAHEATHWTGHKSRCDRDLRGRFGSESYAAEELVAELGAAFLCADLALASEPRPDHAAYVASWLKVLKADSRAIFTAAAKAQQATDWMHSRQAPASAEPMERAA